MDAHLLNPVHLEIVCNFILSPFKEPLGAELRESLRRQFKSTDSLKILFVSWDASSEEVHQDRQHAVYYLRSLKTIGLLTKYHLSSLMGKHISRLINCFGKHDQWTYSIRLF